MAFDYASLRFLYSCKALQNGFIVVHWLTHVGVATNMATPNLHPGSIRTEIHTCTALQPHRRPQANGISPESTDACAGPPSHAGGMQCTASLSLSVPATKSVCHAYEEKLSAVRRQDDNTLLALHYLTTGQEPETQLSEMTQRREIRRLLRPGIQHQRC